MRYMASLLIRQTSKCTRTMRRHAHMSTRGRFLQASIRCNDKSCSKSNALAEVRRSLAKGLYRSMSKSLVSMIIKPCTSISTDFSNWFY